MEPIKNLFKRFPKGVGTCRGTAPLLLSAPHDGRLLPPPYEIEALPRLEYGYGRDSYCIDLLYDLAAAYKQVSHQQPYTVFCLTHRFFVDVNRSINDSRGLPFHKKNLQAKQVWCEYHACLREFVNEIRKNNRTHPCLLLDLHEMKAVWNDMQETLISNQGTPRLKYGLVIGSLHECGKQSYFATLQKGKPDLLHQILRPHLHGKVIGSGRYRGRLFVWPASEDVVEKLGGRNILQTNGGQNKNGIPALQLEHSQDILRIKNIRKSYAELLAHTLFDWLSNSR